MNKYVQEIIDESPMDYDGEVNTPAANHLFDVNESSKNIVEEDAVIFHHIDYQSSFFCANGVDQIFRMKYLS